MANPKAANQSLSQRIIDHPANANVLADAAKGTSGPAAGYLIPGLDLLYPVTVVFHTARQQPTRWFYHVDGTGKLWLPQTQPRVMMAIPKTPDLSADGGWHVP